jgi:uncharacterized membrane protein YdjX (TVP38/TMEM64 family)
MDFFISITETAEWLSSFGIWAIIVSMLLGVLISVIGVIPPVFLTAANAVVFGIWPGFLISLSTEIIGAAVSYWVYRGILKKAEQADFTRKMPIFNPRQWRWIGLLKVASRRRRAILMLIAFMTPFMPSPLITFAAATVRVNFLDFLVVALIGKAPSIALETLIGHDLLFLSDNWPRLIIAIVMLAVLVLLVRRASREG